MVSGRTGRIKVSGAVVGRAGVGAVTRIIDALLGVRERVSTVISFGSGAGGAGKDPYNCMILSSVGDGVERMEVRMESGSRYAFELGLSAREASNIFSSRTISRSASAIFAFVVAVGGGVGMPYTDTEWSESERSYLELSRSLGKERERLGRCHATVLGGRRTTGDRGKGTEHDRVWLMGWGCSDGEFLTSTVFKFSIVGRLSITGLTGAGLTNGWEAEAALPRVGGEPFRPRLA